MEEKQPLLGSNTPQRDYQFGAPSQDVYQGVPPPRAAIPGEPTRSLGNQPSGAYQQHGRSKGRKGEITGADVDDISAVLAPPLENMDTVTGYDHIGFDSAPLVPPPTYDEVVDREPTRREAQTSNSLPKIEEEEAKEALSEFLAEKSCCCSGVDGSELKFTDLRQSCAHHYILETFAEGRSTSMAYAPYSGQPIDGPQNGPAPGPWDIQASPPQMFTNQKTELEVPHSASVKPCHRCVGNGRVRCDKCQGQGGTQCNWCGGSGSRLESVHKGGHWEHRSDGRPSVYHSGTWQQESRPCTGCHGNGRKRCNPCIGLGMVNCTVCQGHCNLKCYIKLTVSWTNHKKDHIVDRTGLPGNLIHKVSGKVVFEEQESRVSPINHFQDSEINTASNRIVTQQASAFPMEKIIMQRHHVRIVPVTRAFYRWDDKDYDAFVYGFEKKVHAPDYPEQCCFACNLL